MVFEMDEYSQKPQKNRKSRIFIACLCGLAGFFIITAFTSISSLHTPYSDAPTMYTNSLQQTVVNSDLSFERRLYKMDSNATLPLLIIVLVSLLGSGSYYAVRDYLHELPHRKHSH